MTDRNVWKRKREAHLAKLRAKRDRIGMLEDILREQESRPTEDQDIPYVMELRRRLRRTQCEFQNMNQA